MDYSHLNDYELLSYINESNEEIKEVMFDKYKPLILSIAKRISSYLTNTGLDINDLIQEGMVGFNHAINNFDEKKDITFYTYAKTCVERSMINTIIGANRKKHKILNDSVSLDLFEKGNEFGGYEDILGDTSGDPERIIIDQDQIDELYSKIKDYLTPFELQVFELKANGFNYVEIADILEKEPKNIDNALQRIKNKLKDRLLK